jgi:hypothetical protein
MVQGFGFSMKIMGFTVPLRDASLRSRMPVARRIKDGDPSEKLATITENFTPIHPRVLQ